MLKIHLLLTVCSLAQAAYISRMATVNRMRPVAFRPGVTLQRPWNMIVPAASNRAPYIVHRTPPHRYVMKHINQHANRNLMPAIWKATRLPQIVQLPTPSNGQTFEYLRAAPATPTVHSDGGTGAIHTIPAPNLSLAEKPIVVLETSENSEAASPQTESEKTTYEVTEKVPEVYQMAKVEMPTGFSKATALSQHELESLLKSATAFHLPAEYNSSPVLNIPQQYIPAGFKAIQTHQEVIPIGAQPVMIPQQAIIQPDPNFFQTVNAQNFQQLSPIEFIPFVPDVPTPKPLVNHEPPSQNQLVLLTNEHVKTQEYTPGEEKTIVQRETKESSVLSLIPQPFTTTTEKIDVTTDPKPNVTLHVIPTESHTTTTTVKYDAENSTEQLQQNVTPIYYAQIGQSIGNVIANGFYSAINDVRAAASLAQAEKPQGPTKANSDNSTTTLTPDSQRHSVERKDKIENQNMTSIMDLFGAPFGKTADSVKVAYTLVRSEESDPKVTKEGTVYAGQIVEASISEDTDFNNEKVNLIQRAPIRLVAVSEQNDILPAATNVFPKVTFVKAKIPPKTKLLFDDKTGEPILRVYASYSENPKQKEIITSKLSSIRRGGGGKKNEYYEKLEPKGKLVDSAKASTNQATQFGLKIKDRSDDYIPLYEDYDE